MDKQTPTLSAEPLLQWSAPIHPVHDRSPRWYLYGGIFIVACAVYGVLTDAWTFALVMLLIGGLYFLTRRAPPVVRQITILPSGFLLGDAFTGWQDCKDFWIIRTPAYAELRIAQKKKWNPEAAILVHPGIDLTQIRATLSQFLPERSDQKERLVDMLIRFCKL